MDQDEFNQILSDKGFWRHNFKGSLIPYAKANKTDIISKLYSKISSREYYPSPPENYLISNKGKSVLRVIPVFRLEDLCVYFYCTRKLEKYIANNRVPGTYGGWSLGGVTKTAEDEDMTEYDEENVSIQEYEGDHYVFLNVGEYTSESNFNPLAWTASWNDFTNKIYKYSIDHECSFVAELDVANFYDTVRLDHLEYIVRNNIESVDNDVVYLLFHFLKYWNRHNNFYVNQDAGLPQDLFGECSRILANFYLQSYDRQMKELCDAYGAKYFRYADDQIVFADSVEIVNLIVAKASSFLMKIGLNLNQKKVNIMEKSIFNHYFGFDVLMDLGGKGDADISSNRIDSAIDFYILHKESLRSGGRTLVRAILSNLSKVKGKSLKKVDLMKLVLTREFLITHPPSFTDYRKIYQQGTVEEKDLLLKLLDTISTSCLHTDFLFHYRRFLVSEGISDELVQKNIDRVNSMYNFKVN